MKILVIPDLHGKDVWKQALNNLQFDKVVFLGDYVDSFNHTPEEIIANLRDIIVYKEANMDKVVLLLGNHDIQYAYAADGGEYRCSGFNAAAAPIYQYLFQFNKALFSIAYEYFAYGTKFLFTHAGVTDGWLKDNIETISLPIYKSDSSGFAGILNNVNDSHNQKLLHQVSHTRGGNNRFGGITWADKSELLAGPELGYHHVVGHSKVNHIHHRYFNDQTSVTLCDCLDTVKEFLIIDTNKFTFSIYDSTNWLLQSTSI